jgi:ubiquinone/menaquinone biosynthesis C-methylase UbiE
MLRRFSFQRQERIVPLLLAYLIASASTIVPLAAFQDARPINIGNPSTIEDFKAGDADRKQQRATDLISALQLSTGDWTADIGAGGGYYSMRMAETVGPTGKVFAEDITEASMKWLNLRVSLFHLSNVEVVKGAEDDPHLPAERLAGILIVDTYHHFTNYQTMLKKMLNALEPGGRLVIADFSLAEHRIQPRADQVKLHEIDPNLVRKEIESAGFENVKLDESFVKWNPSGPNWKPVRTDMWMMTAIRPK